MRNLTVTRHFRQARLETSRGGGFVESSNRDPRAPNKESGIPQYFTSTPGAPAGWVFMTTINRFSTRSETETMMASYYLPGAGIDHIRLECPGECLDRPSRPRRELACALSPPRAPTLQARVARLSRAEAGRVGNVLLQDCNQFGVRRSLLSGDSRRRSSRGFLVNLHQVLRLMCQR
jgi:hypothetical protein